MTTTQSRDPSRKPSAKAAKATKRAARPAQRAATPAKAPKAEKAAKPATPSRKRARGAAAEFTRLREIVLGALDDMKSQEVRELDVRGRSDFADLMVVASGTSSRHVRSIADELVRRVKAAGVLPLGVEGADDAEWVLVDLGDIVAHVMQPRTREFYGLERLWSVGAEPESA